MEVHRLAEAEPVLGIFTRMGIIIDLPIYSEKTL
jgi:hypothetical protein